MSRPRRKILRSQSPRRSSRHLISRSAVELLLSRLTYINNDLCIPPFRQPAALINDDIDMDIDVYISYSIDVDRHIVGW
jgi:hypothetical protein